MNTQSAIDQIKLQYWAEIIHDRCESGLNVDEYCKRHQLSRNAYYYWLRKLRRTALEPGGPVFAELTLQATGAVMPKCNTIRTDHADTALSMQIGGAVINISMDTPKELLAMVVEVLKNA